MRTEVVGETFPLVTGLSLLVCESIAIVSKVRIPPPATTRSDLNSAGSSRKFKALRIPKLARSCRRSSIRSAEKYSSQVQQRD
jgi:hypothetical protein